jgi:hypothetical protein
MYTAITWAKQATQCPGYISYQEGKITLEEFVKLNANDYLFWLEYQRTKDAAAKQLKHIIKWSALLVTLVLGAGTLIYGLAALDNGWIMSGVGMLLGASMFAGCVD